MTMSGFDMPQDRQIPDPRIPADRYHTLEWIGPDPDNERGQYHSEVFLTFLSVVEYLALGRDGGRTTNVHRVSRNDDASFEDETARVASTVALRCEAQGLPLHPITEADRG